MLKEIVLVRSPYGISVTFVVTEAPCEMVEGIGAISSANIGSTVSKTSGAEALRSPDVPVIVRIEAYDALVVVRVSSLDSLVGFLLHVAVRPPGIGEVIARFTSPVNPPYRITDTVAVAVAPTGIWMLDGENKMLKPGASTFRVSETFVWVEPLVPVTITSYDPRTAEDPTDSVRTLLPVPGLALKDDVTPWGRPDTARLTGLENPFCATTEMVDVP